MDAMKVAQAINSLAPGAQWSLRDPADLSTLDWQDIGQPRPSNEAILAQVARLAAPAALSPVQAREALWNRGLLDRFDAWIDAQPKRTQNLWHYSLTYEREASVLTAGLAALRMNAEEIDQFFREASA